MDEHVKQLANESEEQKGSPSGATLKRLKLKVGSNTLHITPGHHPLPGAKAPSVEAGHPPSSVDHDNFRTSEKRKRQAVSKEEEDLTDFTDSDSPPPVRKRTSAQHNEEEQGLRKRRSPKPKVIWDPDESERAKKAKGSEFAKKVKSPARDGAEEGSLKTAELEALDVPSEEKRERRLSKPKVIWDPDDVDQELLRVVNKGGPVNPQAQHTSPKHVAKKVSKPSTGLAHLEAPAISPKAQTPVLQASANSPSVRIGTPKQITLLPSPHTGAHFHRPTSATGKIESLLQHDRVPLSPGLLTPSKRKDAPGSPQGVSLPGNRSPPGFKAPAERTRVLRDEAGERIDGVLGDGLESQGLASPGKKLSNKKKMREDTEAERQLKKEEQRRKRKADTEKAAREVQASAIQKILGQESTRKKREEAVQKRRDAKEEERLASGHEAPGDMVRVVDNASGVTVIWPAAIPFPSALTQPLRGVPPARPTCAAPSCQNVFKYRDSKSRLPLCSLQCYKALRSCWRKG